MAALSNPGHRDILPLVRSWPWRRYGVRVLAVVLTPLAASLTAMYALNQENYQDAATSYRLAAHTVATLTLPAPLHEDRTRTACRGMGQRCGRSDLEPAKAAERVAVQLRAAGIPLERSRCADTAQLPDAIGLNYATPSHCSAAWDGPGFSVYVIAADQTVAPPDVGVSGYTDLGYTETLIMLDVHSQDLSIELALPRTRPPDAPLKGGFGSQKLLPAGWRARVSCQQPVDEGRCATFSGEVRPPAGSTGPKAADRAAKALAARFRDRGFRVDTVWCVDQPGSGRECSVTGLRFRTASARDRVTITCVLRAAASGRVTGQIFVAAGHGGHTQPAQAEEATRITGR